MSQVPDRMQQHAASFFDKPHHFVINNPMMFGGGTLHRNQALEKLGEYTMPGAEFDSSERDPPPRCHPGTRTAIIQKARNWFHDSQREHRLLWLHGPAGVGKSAIMQTMAETESRCTDTSHLGAALFFSKASKRNDPRRVFTTIAYQLAIRIPDYREFIEELLLRDPRCLNKAMGEQFRMLVFEPFVKRNIGRDSGPLLVLLDGLDECGPGDHAGGESRREEERNQNLIIQLISLFALEYPSVPLVWLIASRPEPHLKATFSSPIVKLSFWQEHIPIDSDDSCLDVERYLESEFDNMRQRYPLHILSFSLWPSREQYLRLAEAAAGLFVFAAVVIRFIDDPRVGNPISQLDFVLSVVDKSSRLPDNHNPLATLDIMYAEILRRIPNDTFTITRRLLSCHLLDGYYELSLQHMANILCIRQDVTYSAVHSLHSVLDIPSPADARKRPIKFLHRSFLDYLEHPWRSESFSINTHHLTQAVAELWLGCIRILHEANSSQQPDPKAQDVFCSWPSGDSHSLKEFCDELFYIARRDWAYSFRGIPMNYANLHALGTTYGKSLTLQSAELLSIIERVDFNKLHGYVSREVGRDTYACEVLDFIGYLAALTDPSTSFTEELRQRHLFQLTTLGSLDMSRVNDDKIAFHCRVLAPVAHWTRYNDKSEHDDDDQYSLGAILYMVRLRQEQSPGIRVMIWGGDPSRRCAIFQIHHDELGSKFSKAADGSRWKHLSDGEVYLIPYSSD